MGSGAGAEDAMTRLVLKVLAYVGGALTAIVFVLVSGLWLASRGRVR